MLVIQEVLSLILGLQAFELRRNSRLSKLLVFSDSHWQLHLSSVMATDGEPESTRQEQYELQSDKPVP